MVDDSRRAPRARPRTGEVPEDSAHRLLKFSREGRLAEVERELGALADDAKDWRVAVARGWVAARRGRYEAAEHALREAVSLSEREPEAPLLLARLYRTNERHTEAAAAYRRVLDIDPRHAEARAELAESLHVLGARAEAMSLLARLRDETASGDWPAERLHWLAAAYTRIGKEGEAIPLLEKAAEAAPAAFGTSHALRQLRGKVVPYWHFAMMQDEARNAAYAEALGKTVTPESLVLEIGTGSGLLAMLAAKAGARHVFTCESEPLLAETARRIIADNGLSDRITVIAKASQQLRLGEDLPEPAGILLSELLSDSVYAEDLLAVTADARARLLQPDAQLIPWKVSAVTCLAGGSRLAAASQVGTAAGFDLRRFNRFAPGSLSVSLTEKDFLALSAPLEAFPAELAAPPEKARQELFSYRTLAEGTAAGLLQWNRLYLAEGVVFENAPPVAWQPSSWRQTFFAFDRPVEVAPGDDVEVTGLHNGKLLSFLEGRWR